MQAVIIRHMETDWNRAGKMQGRRDIPISSCQPDAEKEIIRKQKAYLCRLGPFDSVLVSTLKRTKQTAAAYGYWNPIIEPLLDELDFGKFEGRPKAELIDQLGEDWRHHPRSLELGEPLTSLENRVVDCLRRYEECRRILIFGHGSWIRACLSIQKTGDLEGMNRIELANNELINIPEVFTGKKGETCC